MDSCFRIRQVDDEDNEVYIGQAELMPCSLLCCQWQSRNHFHALVSFRCVNCMQLKGRADGVFMTRDMCVSSAWHLKEWTEEEDLLAFRRGKRERNPFIFLLLWNKEQLCNFTGTVELKIKLSQLLLSFKVLSLPDYLINPQERFEIDIGR